MVSKADILGAHFSGAALRSGVPDMGHKLFAPQRFLVFESYLLILGDHTGSKNFADIVSLIRLPFSSFHVALSSFVVQELFSLQVFFRETVSYVVVNFLFIW